MTVNIDKLLKMANQITLNMAYTDDDEVVAERVADHLNRFWDPRMRATLMDHASANPGTLDLPLDKAIKRLDRGSG